MIKINDDNMKMVIHLLRVGNLIDREVSETLKQFNITHIQFNILRMLEAEEKKCLYAGDISRGLIFSTSDVTRLLDRLEKKGLISRGRCSENRRKVKIVLTNEGQKFLDIVVPKVRNKLDGTFINVVDEKERFMMLEILRRIK